MLFFLIASFAEEEKPEDPFSDSPFQTEKKTWNHANIKSDLCESNEKNDIVIAVLYSTSSPTLNQLMALVPFNVLPSQHVPKFKRNVCVYNLFYIFSVLEAYFL